MKLSLIIPAYNEAQNLPDTLRAFYEAIKPENFPFEILVVNDNSKDETEAVLQALQAEMPELRYVNNPPPHNGFGYAVRKGLDSFDGDCVAIVMADLSDLPEDLLMYYYTMKHRKVDCVFGSRFIRGGKVVDYPWLKLRINRMANNIVRFIFGIRYNDCTNAFKLYRKTTIDGLRPFLAPHFNLTLELSLKAIVRGYTYAVVPNKWINRKHGKSNLRIREMGSRYFFILLYCLIEKFFSKGDFKKKWD